MQCDVPAFVGAALPWAWSKGRPAGRRPAVVPLARSAGFARAGGPSRADREAIRPTRPYGYGTVRSW